VREDEDADVPAEGFGDVMATAVTIPGGDS
jgi:hypothetical protein